MNTTKALTAAAATALIIAGNDRKLDANSRNGQRLVADMAADLVTAGLDILAAALLARADSPASAIAESVIDVWNAALDAGLAL